MQYVENTFLKSSLELDFEISINGKVSKYSPDEEKYTANELQYSENQVKITEEKNLYTYQSESGIIIIH